GAAYRAAHPELTVPQALERVAPWANALLLAVVVLVLTPLAAAGLGAAAGALLALGCVAVFPFYDAFGVGYLDHHGAAAAACLAAVLFLAAGGAGWVGAEGSGAAPGGPPSPRRARA